MLSYLFFNGCIKGSDPSDESAIVISELLSSIVTPLCLNGDITVTFLSTPATIFFLQIRQFHFVIKVRVARHAHKTAQRDIKHQPVIFNNRDQLILK